jgi:hypothetical protein
LLALPSKVLPGNLKLPALLNVNSKLLDQIAQDITSTARHDVLGQLMAALPKYGNFIIDTYVMPSHVASNGLRMINIGLADMVAVEVWWRLGSSEDSGCLN